MSCIIEIIDIIKWIWNVIKYVLQKCEYIFIIIGMIIVSLFWKYDTALEYIKSAELLGLPEYNRMIKFYKFWHPKKYQKIMSTSFQSDIVQKFIDILQHEAEAWRDNPPQMLDRINPYKDVYNNTNKKQ